MQRILIAASSQSFALALSEHLSDEFDVYRCQTGFEALTILREVEPELAVVDLNISGVDGVDVLKMAKSAGICPKTIAVTGYISRYVIAALEELQVCALMRVPCDISCLAATVMDVAAWDQRERTFEDRVRALLTMLNFKPQTAGYTIAQMCIGLYFENPSQPVTTSLYPKVALQCNGTATQVERALRSTIEAAWKKRNEQVWRMYFPVGKNGKLAKPTNTEFLSRIVECLQRSLTDQEKKNLAV